MAVAMKPELRPKRSNAPTVLWALLFAILFVAAVVLTILAHESLDAVMARNGGSELDGAALELIETRSESGMPVTMPRTCGDGIAGDMVGNSSPHQVMEAYRALCQYE